MPGYNSSDDSGSFDNFGQSFMAMFVLSTTENFPAVLYPGTDQRPVVAGIFFISFLVIFLWLVLPLVQAIVFDTYTEVHERQTSELRVKESKALLAAYHILVDEHPQVMGKTLFVRLLRRVRPWYKIDTCGHIFDALSGLDGVEGLALVEFLNLPEILK